MMMRFDILHRVFSRIMILTVLLGGSSLSARAAVELSEPVTIFSNGANYFGVAPKGVHLATDGGNNVLAVWMEDGNWDDRFVSMKSAFSSDKGETWADSVTIAEPGQSPGTSLSSSYHVDAAYAGNGKWIAFVAIYHADGPVNIYGSESTDAQTWSDLVLIGSAGTDKIGYRRIFDVDSNQLGTVICIMQEHVFRTTDGGITWQHQNLSYLPSGFGSERDSRIAYAGGLKWFRAIAKTGSWSPATLRIFVSVSSDNGATWTAPAEPSINPVVSTWDELSALSAHGSSAVVTCEYGESYITHDDGATWSTSMPDTLVGWSRHFASGIKDDRIIILKSGSEGLLLRKSEDGGATWTEETNAPLQYVEDLLWLDDQELLTCFDVISNDAKLRSPQVYGIPFDGAIVPGVKLDEVAYEPIERLDHRYPAVDVNPDTGRMIAVWSVYTPSDREGFMWSTSDDNGLTWSDAKPIDGINQGPLSYPVTVPELIYAGNDTWVLISTHFDVKSSTLVRSTDDGETWSTPTVFWSGSTRMEFIGSNDAGTILGRGTIYAPLDYYYWRSDDAGATFTTVDGDAYGMAVASLGGTEWIKIDNGQAWHSTNNAATWTARGQLNGFAADAARIDVNADSSAIVVMGIDIGAPTTLHFYQSFDQGQSWSSSMSLTVPFDQTLLELEDYQLRWWRDQLWVLTVRESSAASDQLCVYSYSLDNGSTWSGFEGGGSPDMVSYDGTLLFVEENPDEFMPTYPAITATRFREVTPTAASDWQLFE